MQCSALTLHFLIIIKAVKQYSEWVGGIHSNSIRVQPGRRKTFLPSSGSYQLSVSWLSAASSADTTYRWLHCRTWMKTPRPSGDLNVSSNTSSTKPTIKRFSYLYYSFLFGSFFPPPPLFFYEIIWSIIAGPGSLQSTFNWSNQLKSIIIGLNSA